MMMRSLMLVLALVALAAPMRAGLSIQLATAADPAALVVADPRTAAEVCVDAHDYPVVSLAAGLFAGDLERVTGRPARVVAEPSAAQLVIAGTLGHSEPIDRLVREGKLPLADRLRGGWETTLWQIVEHPFPGVARALVVVGSDRRGTAYGLMTLSERMGVSPWTWWADVPVAHRDNVAFTVPEPLIDAPAVRYRGIFINDEDWGLQPWAAQTFDPAFGNIGPKTYAKVFELMLRLRLNYLWPAMHACSAEFASQPENIRLADRYAIVMGASHCEPMLCNNVHWDERTRGKWDYTLNRDAIDAYWADSARTRGAAEAVWTLGIRGIHDQPMEGPPEIATRLKTVDRVIADQRALLDRYVTKAWGPVAQCFVPYKEVLPIYDAGLQVPDDVTLVWVDDNFGYLRRLSAPAERKRSGGAGVYWHLSYYGGPHSYTWINTTAPGLMWEELHKAWANDARRLWVINVGDIKPMEIGIDYFARLAWNPPAVGPDAQPQVLREFAARNFGPGHAADIATLLGDFYRLGTVRKPELMDRAWACALDDAEAGRLRREYTSLRQRADALAGRVPATARDAFTELVAFPVQVLGSAGLVFLADRDVQRGADPAQGAAMIAQLRRELEARVAAYNDQVAGGKWKRMMPGLVTGKKLMAWSSQVRWPWGEPSVAKMPKDAAAATTAAGDTPATASRWRDAAEADRQSGAARWTPINGLGTTARAVEVLPASLASSWPAGDSAAPTLEYDFDASGANGSALIDFLPTFRMYPGMKLRVAVGVDHEPPRIVEVPGSSGREDEGGSTRSTAVQANYVRVALPLPRLGAGRHTLKISAMDPGAVIDRVALP